MASCEKETMYTLLLTKDERDVLITFLELAVIENEDYGTVAEDEKTRASILSALRI